MAVILASASRQGQFALAPVLVPEGLPSDEPHVLRVTGLIDGVALDNPTLSISVMLETSPDGGATWRMWAMFTWRGPSPSAATDVLRQPSMDVASPPPGTLARATISIPVRMRVGMDLTWL